MSAQDPKYAVVNNFNRKLLDLQDKLKNTSERELSEKVSRFAKDLMTLQMHDSPMTREEDLDTAITDVTIASGGSSSSGKSSWIWSWKS